MRLAPLRRHVPDAGAEALAILDPARGAIEAPIRAEIFGAARFRQHGHSLGEAHAATRQARRSPAFFPRLADNIRVLDEAHRYIGLQEHTGHHVSPAGEWLLDNFHIVVAQVKEIRDGLPRRYFRDLPVLVDAHLAGLPRVYGIAWAFVAHTDSAFDEDLLVDFLGAYQEKRELTLGELWALPTTLRVVLIENLRRLSERVAAAKAAREVANLWCDGLERPGDQDADVQTLFETMRERGVGQAFALQVAQRRRTTAGAANSAASTGTDAPAGKDLDAALARELAQALPDLDGAQVQQQAEQAANNLSVSNAITSLRLLADTDWRGIVERTSVLMQLLQASPTFRAERDDTQDSTLHAIEALARRSQTSELSVAHALLALMQAPPDERAVAAGTPIDAPSHWLRSGGRAEMRRAVGLGPTLLPSWGTVRRRVALQAYLGTVALLSAALTAWFVGRAGGSALSLPWVAFVALLAVWPASEAVIAVLNRLISESVPPRRLPRLALNDGIPPEHRVLVVVPAMLGAPGAAKALARQLERHHLANLEVNAQYALLTDYTDADSARTDGDAAVLAEAVAAIDALEQRHASGQADTPRRFLLLHRERSWSETEQRWIGHERKRGKLEQLVALLACGEPAHFVDLGARSQPLAGTPYIVTLDSDTLLPPGALRELVGVAAHPLNRPRIDAAHRRVIAGYGILQPRVATPLPGPAEATPFHWLFAGQGGIDPYGSACSEIYQDVFEEGSFSGKGLLNVAALQAVLAERLPVGQILSHDLLEGSIARCGGVSDITLIEGSPVHADVAAARLHRWTRGDWQLLPVLGHAGHYGLRTINRWKLFDNLRRSLVAPFSVALLIAGLAGAPVPVWAALALVAAAFGAGPMLGAVAGFAPSRDDVALGHFYRVAASELARAVGGALWNLALLLQNALSMADAIARALWRSTVSRRLLLQWTTAAAAQAAARSDWPGLARRHAPATLAATLLLAGLIALGTAHPALAAGLCLAWAATPLWIGWASRAHSRAPVDVLPAADRDYLYGVARDTWQLFERHVNADSHHLPPDNVQTVPQTMVAQRTSPTNIGLYLLSAACARRFGFIDTEALLARSEQTLATLATLPRYHGHFMNWIDTRTLATLTPPYVSTVDSGNLCGHLVAFASACDEITAEPALAARLAAVAATCRRLADEAAFGFLYDSRRRLFHIGYRIDDQTLDKSYYDLLASESRLASLWAIAKGDVPVAHWGALGRPYYAVGRETGLRSWSGSMFEYLMPALVLDEPDGNALQSAERGAVHEQIAYARGLGVPWGMSESAYAASDHTLAYQYAPQGVPRLALRRTPPDDVVVAPYATALAAMREPAAAVANFRRLEALSARHALGFAEALDYTAERQVSGTLYTEVSTFMAHHQGMTIVALANVLLGGIAQRWGMADARLDAVASLLQERVPHEVSRLLAPPPGPSRSDRRDSGPGSAREVMPGATALQPTHLLSNGRYSVALRANGAGWSRHGQADISRWRDDALRDAHGTFFYLRRHPRMAPVSITQHPAPDPAAHYTATFHNDRVALDAEWADLRSRCTVWVSPEDDIELRRVELWNTTGAAIELELMSMFEVALSDARADEAHPAFANLFVQADADAPDHALYYVRKPRRPGEDALHAVHFITDTGAHVRDVQVQTDRMRWLGRGRDATQPMAGYGGTAPSQGAQVTGLDPVAALSLQLVVPARGSAHITFATAAAGTRATLETLVDRYRQAAVVERSTLMSATFASIRLREQRSTADDRAAVQILTTALTLLVTRHANEGDPSCDRRAMWRIGLSGDRPLIVVTISAVQGVRLVRTLVQALRQWSWGGLACDLVLLNSEAPSYLMPLQRELQALRERHDADTAATPAARAGALRVLQTEELSAAERATLAALARVRLNADGRPLWHHVQELSEWHDAALDSRREQSAAVLPPALHAAATAAPTGSFDAASGGFRFGVSALRRPQRPWVNVLANADFGALVSEAGAGFTWAGNSRLNQLTPWSNDPVTDASSEFFGVQDLRTREVWNVGAGLGQADAVYDVEHGQGVTLIRHRRGDLAVSVRWCVDPERAVKQVRITLSHQGSRTLRLRVIGALEWVLGERRTDRQSVRTAFANLTAADSSGDALLATQCDAHAGFGGTTAFFAVRGPARADHAEATLADWTCDRRELFDARGRRVVPDHFGERAGTGLDPCAAIGLAITVRSGETAECSFLIGHAGTPLAARELAREVLAVAPRQREGAVRRHWDTLLGAVTVATPDPLFDSLVNHWLLYQTLACRLWGRAGFYQAGGAFGFRDQLQDTLALTLAAPELLRAQLLLAASRQFVEGDVQHWWHAPTGAGVRTHFSDDLLWLPLACARYIGVTGRADVLDETVPFLEGEAIPAGAEDAYFVPQTSAQHATLYEHAARTIDRSLAVGAHGLPLMGSGDWNDGMNRVGAHGHGESVWMGWFLCRVVADFMPLAQARGDTERAQRWAAAAVGWRTALHGAAWDGAWFARAFFDDGTPLGSHANAECRIDLIAQAWSVLSGAGDEAQQRTAMASAQHLLVDEAQGLIRLLDPPLQNALPDAGYIQAYPPGVRENGGQYSHAGVWWLMAQAALGDADGAYLSFKRLSPAHRSANAQAVLAYGLEPYVMAADVYSQPPYAGRGGWSWYTGSAGWMHRAAVESICGLQVRVGRACITPQLPGHWPQVTLTLRRGGRTHRFVVCAAAAMAEQAAALAEGARTLRPGEWLDLDKAGDESLHVVVAAPGNAAPSYTLPRPEPTALTEART